VPDDAGGSRSPIEPAVAWAEHLRRTRAEVLGDLGEHRCELADVLESRIRPDVGAVHLRAVLEALPDARRIDTRRRLAELGLPERTPLSELEDASVVTVLEAFGPGGS
jgi:hypothetical protein